jgi:glucokinase
MTDTIGIDVGGTKILGVRRRADGTISGELRAASVYDREPLLAAIAEVARSLGLDDVAAIGVGIAGMVTPSGSLRYGPNLPGVEEVDVLGEIAARTNRPTVVDNDANVAGYAEVVQGAARGSRHALVVTLGTGIGGALIVDGSVYRGANGFAGEIGHWTVERGGPRCACGARGHWEAIASGTALTRMARDAQASGSLDLEGDVDGHLLGLAARAGDVGARALLAEYADNVALGLAGLATVLDPECVVISGGVVGLGDCLFDPLQVAFARHLEGESHRPPIALRAAMLGERAGAIGAAALAATIGA